MAQNEFATTEYQPRIHTIDRRPIAKMIRVRTCADFASERGHLKDWVDRELLPCLERGRQEKFILVSAPVKSGKREMPEYLATYDKEHNIPRKHVFASALYRIVDDGQRDEIAKYGIAVFAITKQSAADECAHWINELAQNYQVVVHIDECDYGSKVEQLLSQVWYRIIDKDSVKPILYSATPEEARFAEVCDDIVEDFIDEAMLDPVCFLRYRPPETYCGSEVILREGLGYDATKFCKFKKIVGEAIPNARLTRQGRKIIRDMQESIRTNPRRNVLILRAIYGEGGVRRDDKAIYKFIKYARYIPELRDEAQIYIRVVGERKHYGRTSGIDVNPFSWDTKADWDHLQTSGVINILVIDQAASRSTELRGHDRIFAYHDYRHEHVYNTITQAQERVVHYSTTYNGFQPIRVYGDCLALMVSAGAHITAWVHQ